MNDWRLWGEVIVKEERRLVVSGYNEQQERLLEFMEEKVAKQ